MPLMADSIELVVIGLIDVIGADALEHVAEQVELSVGIGGSRFGAGAEQQRVRLGYQQRYRGSGQRTEENQRGLAHHPRTFSPSFVAHQGLGSMGVPSLRNSTIEYRLLRSGGNGGRYLRFAAHHRYGFTGQYKLAKIDGYPLHPR